MAIVFMRTIVIYILIIFALRLMGKRQLAQLQPSEFVITILISNIATLPLQDTDIPLIGGIIPIISLVAFEILVSTVSLKSRKFRSFLSGKSKIIIEDGCIDQKMLKELRYSLDDLLSELRNKNIFDVKDVSYAIVQTNGVLNVYPKFEAQPVTAGMMQLKQDGTCDQIQFLVIADGQIVDEGLKGLQLSIDWINEVLNKNNKNIKDIFLMTAKNPSDYYIVYKY